MRQTGLIVSTIVGIAILLGLGTWQVKRLQWKQDLIARIELSATANPVTLNDVEAGDEHGYDVDWLRVTVEGYYRHDLERHVYALRKGAPGWRIFTPLVMPGNYIVFIDRGFVPDANKQAASRPKSRAATPDPQDFQAKPRAEWPKPLSVTGVVRLRTEGRPWFAPDNEPENNRWYWHDLQAMAASLPDNLGAIGGEKVARIIPFTIQLEPGGELSLGKLPIVDPVKPELRNRHLGYALTWYGLAGVLAVIAFSFWRSRRRKQAEQ